MAIYPAEFRPLATSDLIRVGGALDGGYVIPERLLTSSKGLLSFGLCDDWTFESAFVKRARCPVVVFDPSVTARFWGRRISANLLKGAVQRDPHKLRRAFRFIDYRLFFRGDRKHIRRAVGAASQGGVTLTDAMTIAALPGLPFLKIDIEGWEYRILDEVREKRAEFSGLAIEFHDVDLHQERIADFIKAVSDQWLLVHFHPNTHTQAGPEGFALAVEMTFLNRKLLTDSDRLESLPLPIQHLDAPNIEGNVHAKISFRS